MLFILIIHKLCDNDFLVKLSIQATKTLKHKKTLNYL